MATRSDGNKQAVVEWIDSLANEQCFDLWRSIYYDLHRRSGTSDQVRAILRRITKEGRA